MDKVISFPHIGNYYVPIEWLVRKVFSGCEVRPAPSITKRTLELGSKYSPDFVCVPFKYNLGNFIEALENGANVLFQAGGGCRYGYYGEVQEQILRDLGYDFVFVQLLSNEVNILEIFRTCRELGVKISFPEFVHCFLTLIRMVYAIDNIESYIRENIGFETEPGSFERLHGEFLDRLKSVEGLHDVASVYGEYERRFRELKIDKPEDCYRIGMVGELYTLMEPFSNFFMEKEMAKNKMVVSRYITVSYLLFEKSRMRKNVLSGAGKYLKYAIGADGTDSVATSKTLAEEGYDGIIHVKPFGCTPEVNAMPMLQNISRDHKIPILYFSFDSQTSETGVKTRLEAFNDMIVMGKRGQEIDIKNVFGNSPELA